jgi:hypothetical protein
MEYVRYLIYQHLILFIMMLGLFYLNLLIKVMYLFFNNNQGNLRYHPDLLRILKKM